MTKEEKAVDRHIIIVLCNMGIPMGLQYSITAIGSVVLQTAVNGLGSMAVAAVTAGSKISLFFCCPFDALGSTMATYGCDMKSPDLTVWQYDQTNFSVS